MRSTIDDYRKISKKLKEEYPMMEDFEILSLAIQIERNQILENGLGVSYADRHPAALQAIAISLGYTDKSSLTTITNVLQQIADKENL